MSVSPTASLYLEINILIGVVVAVVWGLDRDLRPRFFGFGLPSGGLRPRFRVISAVGLLRLSRGLVVAAIGVPILLRLAPVRDWEGPAAQLASELRQARLEVPAAPEPAPSPVLRQAAGTEVPWLAILGTGLVLALGRYGWRARKLKQHLESLPLIHGLGRVRVVADPREAYAARVGFTTYLALPERAWAEASASRKILFAHEAQHVRQHDPLWAHAEACLRALVFWNPMARLLSARMCELQELACDEALVGRRGISPRVYAGCLLEAAETAIRTRSAGLATHASGTDARLLERRVRMLFEPSKKKTIGRTPWVLALAFGFVIAAAAGARNVSGQLSPGVLTKLEKTVSRGSGTIPLALNAEVRAYLEKLLGSESGRRWLKESRARLPQYRETIETVLAEAGVPAELIAMAWYESGFKNSVQHKKSGYQTDWQLIPFTAGLWQFTVGTASTYGLIVRPDKDERLDIAKSTKAAANYFHDLHRLFGDWRLAIRAYNEGEVKVESLIKKFGTKDPWELERAAPTGFLPGAIAMMLLWKNPEAFE